MLLKTAILLANYKQSQFLDKPRITRASWDVGTLCESRETSEFNETNETEKSVNVAGRNSSVFCVLKS